MATKTITMPLWQRYTGNLELVQHESSGRTLFFNLVDASGAAIDLTGATVVFNMTKGAEVIYNDCTVVSVTAGKISVLVTSGFCDTAGEFKAFIEITKTGSVQRTQDFVITVKDSADNTEAVEASSEFTALTVALATVAAYDARITAAEAAIDLLKYGSVVSISLASGSYTLAAVDYSKQVLIVTTGHASNAIILPSEKYKYLIINTSAQNVLVKKSGGTAITIPAGKNAIVAYNGSQYVFISKPTPAGDLVGTTDTQILTNKTLTTPTLTNPTINYDITWSTPTFTNGWVNFGGTEAVARYHKDALGYVHIEGLIKSGTMNNVAFTLPTGYRPEYNLNIITVSNDAFAKLQITSGGAVIPMLGSNTWFSLGGYYKAV